MSAQRLTTLCDCGETVSATMGHYQRVACSGLTARHFREHELVKLLPVSAPDDPALSQPPGYVMFAAWGGYFSR